MKAKSVQLVSAPLDQGFDVGGAGWTQPVGLLCLATHLRNECPWANVEILDGAIHSMGFMMPRLDADVVGFGCTIGNYKNTLALSEAAKARGAYVILGGPYASSLGTIVLRNRSYVDTVIMGPGEHPLQLIVENMGREQVPNTFFRRDGSIAAGPIVRDRTQIVVPDYSLLDPKPYWQYFQNRFPRSVYERPLTVPSQRGCERRVSGNACLFCSVLDASWQGMEPRSLWRVLRLMRNEVGVDYIYDTAEDFPANTSWLDALDIEKPDEPMPTFEICARAKHLNGLTVRKLKRVGVVEVFVGIETGSDLGLGRLNKGTTLRDNLEAARILDEFGLKLYPGLVIGVPGETEKSVRQTVEHVERLRQICRIDRSICFILTPLPGSAAFRQLLSIEYYRKKYSHVDVLDIKALQQDWVDVFCDVDYNYLELTRSSLTKLENSFDDCDTIASQAEK